MPSFDIVSKFETQEVDNAVGNCTRQLANRYDFRGSKTEISFDRKSSTIKVMTEDDMKLKAVMDTLKGCLIDRKVDPKVLDIGEPEKAGGSMLRQEIKLKEGVETDLAKKIVKLIKESKIKVQAKIQDGQVRVEGKKIDDLQTVISMVKEQNYPLPLQYVNMKQ